MALVPAPLFADLDVARARGGGRRGARGELHVGAPATCNLPLISRMHMPVTQVSFTWARHRLFDRLATLLLYEGCVGRRVAHVTAVIAKETIRRRPSPLATVEMQV